MVGILEHPVLVDHPHRLIAYRRVPDLSKDFEEHKGPEVLEMYIIRGHLRDVLKPFPFEHGWHFGLDPEMGEQLVYIYYHRLWPALHHVVGQARHARSRVGLCLPYAIFELFQSRRLTEHYFQFSSDGRSTRLRLKSLKDYV